MPNGCTKIKQMYFTQYILWTQHLNNLLNKSLQQYFTIHAFQYIVDQFVPLLLFKVQFYYTTLTNVFQTFFSKRFIIIHKVNKYIYISINLFISISIPHYENIVLK